MKPQQLTNWLILHSTPTIGEKTFAKMLASQIALSDWVQNPYHCNQMYPLLSQKALAYLAKQHYQPYINRVFKWLESSDTHHILTYHDDSYPTLLTHIPSPPFILFAVGNTQLLHKVQLSVVGTRKCTNYGQKNTRYLVSDLIKYDITITSGLALGIDAEAHKSALDCNGNTIAVLGNGIDIMYPKANATLARHIAQKGLIVSEFPLGQSPDKHSFPKRNRIISGLTRGTIIIESSTKSGSLITAKHAVEQNRDVFAVPGNIHHESNSGCHKLIKAGAKLIENSQDILEELNEDLFFLHHTGSKSSANHQQETFDFSNGSANSQSRSESQDYKTTSNNIEDLDATSQTIINAIDETHTTALDLIIAYSQLDSAKINIKLLELEIAGFIESRPGGYIRT